MKLLLTQRFQAREPRTPIAMMDLAAYGRAFGHEVDVAYDEGQAISGNYDMVGVSAVVVDDDVIDLLRSLRRRYSGRLILGGKGAVTLADESRTMLDQLNVEVFEGPGERLLNADLPIDYATYPTWDREDSHLLKDTYNTKELMSSRGCPYHCHFCNNTEPKVKFFLPERTVSNAEMLFSIQGCNRVFFVDDIFAFRASNMMAILREADGRGLELRKRTQFFIHVNHIDDERLDAIDAYDPAEMQVGIESGDDKMLQAMGKTFTAAKAEDRLKALHGRGHHVACLFLMGFPGETRESLQHTVDFALRNRQYMSGWWVSYYQPVPGTKGWCMARERLGHELTGHWITDVSYVDPNLTAEDLTNARWAIMESQ